MGVQRFYEVSCDFCGCAEHFHMANGPAAKQAQATGWFVTISKKYFDTRKCWQKYQEKTGQIMLCLRKK